MSGGLVLRAPAALPGSWVARLGGLWQAMIALSSSQQRAWRHRCQALEHTLEDLTDRLARSEIALARAQHNKQQAAQRTIEAEAALVRVQSMLDALRWRQAEAADPPSR